MDPGLCRDDMPHESRNGNRVEALGDDRRSESQENDMNKTLATALLLVAASLAGCASTRLDAQWSDPQLVTGTPLKGARVLVVCEAQDEVLRRVCIDQMGSELTMAGAVPVPAPDVGSTSSAPAGPAPYLSAARTANAKAVLVTSLAQNSTVAKPGMTIGVGLGGFGGNVGGGVGVSAPVGGTKVTAGYAANASVTDVASGRLMWTARASAPPSEDVNAQVASLANTVVKGAGKAGLL
jgi:hypothetical protein